MIVSPYQGARFLVLQPERVSSDWGSGSVGAHWHFQVSGFSISSSGVDEAKRKPRDSALCCSFLGSRGTKVLSAFSTPEMCSYVSYRLVFCRMPRVFHRV